MSQRTSASRAIGKVWWLFAAAVGLAGLIGQAASRAAPAPVRITLLGLNDLHGNIEEKSVAIGTGPGAKNVKVGGADVMAAYFDIARRENPRTLVLDAGDAFQGTLLSNHFEGRPVLEAYNAIGIDASTFGNHEFDYGDLNDRAAGMLEDPQGAMKRLLTLARFPYLSANVTTRDSSELVGFANVAPSKIFDLNGIKVGVVGATTESTPKEAAPASLKGLAFANSARSVAKASADLRTRGAQVVVLLAHAGGICDMRQPAERGDEACKSAKPDEITAMLDAMPSGTVDAVLAGHVHTAQAHFIRGVPVVQTFGFGRSFSRVDLWVSPEASALAPARERIARVAIAKPTYFCHEHFANYASCSPEETALGGSYPRELGAAVPATYLGQPIVRVASAAQVLVPYQKETQALIERFVVELPADLAYDRMKESPISNCVADSIKEQIELEEKRRFDLFVSHSGGIRSKLPKRVRFGDVFAVLPFDGTMAVVTLTGVELEAFGRYQSETPKSISVISEGGWKVKLAKEAVFPRHRGFVTPSGEATRPDALYSILTDAFNVAPGGGTDALLAKARAEGRIEVLPRMNRDLFADRLARSERLPNSCLGGALDRTIVTE